MKTIEVTIDCYNSLLRVEIFAIETYTRTIDRFPSLSRNGPCERIRADHVANSASLRRLVGEHGEIPAATSGLWGDLARMAQATGILFGESTALRILLQGEQLGIRKYEKTLANQRVSSETKDLIRRRLLPKLKAHLIELDRYQAKAYPAARIATSGK